MDFIRPIGNVVRSPGFKFVLILILIQLLTIPAMLVFGLIQERENRAQGVRRDVGLQWGPEQRLLGPFVVVPYTVRIETVQGDKKIEQFQERRAVFTPAMLEIDGRADARMLRRSIFEVPVYLAKFRLSGRFDAPRIDAIAADVVSVRWRDAVFTLGMSGVAGLRETAALKIDGTRDIALAPGLGYPSQTATSGVHARLADRTTGVTGATLEPAPATDQPLVPFAFALDLAFNGSVSLTVAPVARNTRYSLSSDWPHPSFTGAFLPDRRTIDAKGFTAAWNVPHLARSVPEAWSLSDAGIERLQSYAFGVVLVDPVGFYGLVNRAAKYATLFVTLAFMAVFCIELVSGRRVHPVQYLFTGVSLVFFYVLLLSLAEHIGFAGAYLAAALATGVMLAVYIGAALRKVAWGTVMLVVFAAIYGILYVILRLEDYALLAGALLGFISLVAVMFTTLRVDWSGAERDSLPDGKHGQR